MKRYRIGELALLSSLSERSIRYYEEKGLIKSERTEGGHRTYSDQDLIYLKRIIELKGLGFSLSEIEHIFSLKSADESGDKRREELLRQYRAKMEADLERIELLKSHVNELEWHVHQLERAGEEGFTSCPGPLCRECEYRARCSFATES